MTGIPQDFCPATDPRAQRALLSGGEGHSRHHRERPIWRYVFVLKHRHAKLTILFSTGHRFGKKEINNIQAIAYSVVRVVILNPMNPVQPILW